ncbi:phosphatase [Lachnospiraceae bacterium 62-35]
MHLKPLADLHTHTIASGHAYSTLRENIEYAAKAGLKVLGTSEHARLMPGASHPMYFRNFKVIPREVDGVRLVNGIEANIYNSSGDIDVDDAIIHKVDYIIASFHIPCYSNLGEVGNTRTLIRVIQNPLVTIIGHPDDDRYPVNHDELAAAAAENHTALEMNNSSLNPLSARTGGRKNILRLLEACRKYKTMVIMGTDSHICYDIGKFEDSIEMLKEVEFPKEQIINFDLDRLSYVMPGI